MNITEIFGTTPRDMMDYVGWLKTMDGIKHLHKGTTIEHESDSNRRYVDFVVEAHSFLSQPMKREWFERPHPINGFANGSYACECGECNEIFMGDKRAVRCSKCSGYDDWQPLFKGEWVIESMGNGRYLAWLTKEWESYSAQRFDNQTTLNDFLYQNKEIDKEYNPNFEI
tara:strand:+ start:8681 stop:9190 length:510 start_codon:yes stop_codon:yes gene_type:complete